MLDRTIKEACLINIAIPSNHDLQSAITEKLQKCTDLEEGLIKIWQLKTAYVIP